jgi:tol-pal system protein YbgF
VRRGGIFALLARLAVVFLLLVPSVHAALFGDDVARKQAADASRRVDELRGQTDILSGRLGKIEESLRNQPTLELLNQIELLKREIQSLRGQLEVVGNNVENTAKRQRDMYVDLDTRMRRMEQPGAATAPGAVPPVVADVAVPPPAAGVAPAAQAGPAGADETRGYEAAQNQRRLGNYQGAITAFQSFLGQYPKSSLAHRAQYWIGDSYFNLRDYKNAIANQQRLLTAYPDSASAPDAMLNIASAQAELGDIAAARRTMDTLVARHPNSDAAEKARRRMTTLR